MSQEILAERQLGGLGNIGDLTGMAAGRGKNDPVGNVLKGMVSPGESDTVYRNSAHPLQLKGN